MIRMILFFGMILFWTKSNGQQNPSIQENKIFKNTILSVQAYNSNNEESIPVIQLNNGEEIIIEFDELGRANSNYQYSIEHCTSDWKISPISKLDYSGGFTSDRISDYKLSFNTLTKYTHYKFNFPNTRIIPKIAGNYIVKVFESGKEKNPVFTQRIYITNNIATVNIDITPSEQVNKRNTHQKVNVNLSHNFPISNPNTDLKVVIMQNFNALTAKSFTQPTYIRNNSLIYNDMIMNDFPGGSEFRKFDIRSLRFKGINVQDIFRDSTNRVILVVDDANSRFRYTSQFDENGNFFIQNQDGRNPKIDADYVNVYFRLKTVKPEPNVRIYVIGRFNNYALTNQNELKYDLQSQSYFGNILLKQGLYDYKYLWVKDAQLADENPIEGNFYETENTYQVFFYYTKPGSRWEELISYSNVNTTKR
ncbi:DUF5103 domain-containing protein [Pedobacter flavus]|uniref:DUF5103 domain-containing protein n=1 Tax=Pedobacter flavus TaxID=3113906 RepID=A0ABU7H1J9_9SPHI|nr:DUF5103 domain-containing protein [Pedobacter sp. VNH31]MEE1885214.1 DUF5103 domain-containing protein [Pedobacter sp. VNH31]